MNWFIRAFALLCLCVAVTAQTTIYPGNLDSRFPSLNLRFDADSLFCAKPNQFVIGHQWGAGGFTKVNNAISTNFTNDNFTYHTEPGDFNGKVANLPTHRNQFLTWGLGRWREGNDTQKLFARPWVGMRWEPAENPGLSRSWAPRDSASWPFSFASRSLGYAPSNSNDQNYRRFVLDTDSATLSVTPKKVLDSCEPRTNLHVLVKDSIVKWNTKSQHTPASETGLPNDMNGRRLFLVVTLRRLVDDSVVDDAPVMKLKVEGRRNNKRDTLQPVYASFISAPDPTGTNLTTLPDGRGLLLDTVAVTGLPSEVVVRQRQLPSGENRDVTLFAEVHVDSNFKNLQGDLVLGNRTRLKAAEGAIYDYSDATKYDHLIDTLTPQVFWYDSVSVAVASVSLLTPEMFDILCGTHDEAFAITFGNEIHAIDTLLHNNAWVGTGGAKMRVAGFYVRDEFDNQEYLGMVYRMHLLNGLLYSDRGYQFYSTDVNGRARYGAGRQMLTGLPYNQIWIYGPVFPSTLSATPYFPIGNEGGGSLTPQPFPAMALKSGSRQPNTDVPFLSRYEHYISTGFQLGGHGPVGSKLFDGANDTITDPMYASSLSANFAANGPTTNYENWLRDTFYESGDWFFSKRRVWWANVSFHYRIKYGKYGTTPYVTHDTWRPATGEEARLSLGGALAFGAKGLIYDRWKPDSDSCPVVSMMAANTDSIRYHGLITPVDKTDWDAVTSVDSDTILSMNELGSDWVEIDDSLRIDDWVDEDAIADATDLDAIHVGDPERRIYLGRRSVRLECKRWHDLVMYNADLFYDMRLLAWKGLGFRELTNGNMVVYNKWLSSDDDRYETHRWTKTYATDTTYQLVQDDSNHRFMDVVLLSQDSVGNVDSSCLIAVTNRMTAPFLIDSTLADSVRFLTTFEFDSLCTLDPTLTYRQVGARCIAIPFDYSSGMSPWLLHVVEVTDAAHETDRIDTVVGSQTTLYVDMKPGDTKFFRVKRIPAHSSPSDGYLAFNTQSKIVAYPVAESDFSGYTDLIRYHMVYHRQDDDTLRGTPWTVFYRRSKPYKRDSVPDVAGIDWETEEYRLSVNTTFAKNSVFYNPGIVKTTYTAAMTNPNATSVDMSCAFPSIVIRDTAANHPVVYVVYSCADGLTGTDTRPLYTHIVENRFADIDTLDESTLEDGGRSIAVIPNDPAVQDSISGLSRIGTPVINASAPSSFASKGTMYYAWSAHGEGIIVGRKSAATNYFTVPGVTEVPMSTIQGYTGGNAAYPSLNVYSNIAHGDTTATLVWQENGHIRYTRVLPGATPNSIDRFLPTFIQMSYVPDSTLFMIQNPTEKIAIISDVDVAATNSMPVVIRSLQPDTMRVTIFDTSGTNNIDGEYRYNTESIAWEQYGEEIGGYRAKIKRKHFFDMEGLNELHYWYSGTTYSNSSSLFHTVLTQGTIKMDTMTWEGIEDSTLITYDGSLFLEGNISDSSIVQNYNILDSGDYNEMYLDKMDDSASYWKAIEFNTSLSTQQIMIKPYPGVPGSTPNPLYHYDHLLASGAWPHLAFRKNEYTPFGMQSLRRVVQKADAIPPSIVASAESFYKPTFDEESENRKRQPVHYLGFDVGGEVIALHATLSDGRDVVFYRQHSTNQTAPAAAILEPLTELVTEPFTIGDVDELAIDISGNLRDDIELTIEEVDARGRTMSTDIAEIGLPEAKQNSELKAGRTQLYLSKGEQRSYRLKAKFAGDLPRVIHEHIEIDPEVDEDSKEKTIIRYQHIDLSALSTTQLSGDNSMIVFPNPTQGDVKVIWITDDDLAGTVQLPSVLRVHDALGAMLYQCPINSRVPVSISTESVAAGNVFISISDGSSIRVHTTQLSILR